MWRTELQELQEEFRLIQFRLLYSNAGDFSETPVSGDSARVTVNFAIISLFAFEHSFCFSFLDNCKVSQGWLSIQTL